MHTISQGAALIFCATFDAFLLGSLKIASTSSVYLNSRDINTGYKWF